VIEIREIAMGDFALHSIKGSPFRFIPILAFHELLLCWSYKDINVEKYCKDT